MPIPEYKTKTSITPLDCLTEASILNFIKPWRRCFPTKFYLSPCFQYLIQYHCTFLTEHEQNKIYQSDDMGRFPNTNYQVVYAVIRGQQIIRTNAFHNMILEVLILCFNIQIVTNEIRHYVKFLGNLYKILIITRNISC